MKKNKEEKNIKENNKKIKNPKVIIVAVLIIIIAFYAIFVVIKLIKNPSNTFIVSNGTLSEEESTSGYIVREEQVIEETKHKNGIIRVKEEGQRVAKDDAVFRYYSSKEEELEDKISKLDAKIQEVIEEEDNSPYYSDKKLLEGQIEEELRKIYGQNNIQKLSEYKKTISTYITKKAKIIGDKSPSGSYLKGLIEERESYEEQLKQESEYVTAPIAGMVSYKIDGFEKVITPENLANLNKNFLEDLKLKVGQTIASSDTTAKIVNNYSNYIIFNSNSQESKQTKVDDKIKIRMQNNTEITAKVKNIIQENDDSRTIAIQMEQNTEEFLSYRKISFDIIWWSASGYRIPNTAIKQVDKITYVIRNRNGYLDKMAVKILKQGKDYSIVEPYTANELLKLGLSLKEIQNLRTLTLYDEILKNPTEEQVLQ